MEGTLVVRIESIGETDLELSSPFDAAIIMEGDSFIARFDEAHVITGGETIDEAISNLKSLVADLYRIHEEARDEPVGPLMARQRAALEKFVRRVV